MGGKDFIPSSKPPGIMKIPIPKHVTDKNNMENSTTNEKYRYFI